MVVPIGRMWYTAKEVKAMRILTSMQMKQAEKNAWEESLSYAQMMENAGAAAAQTIQEKMDIQDARITLFCGRGNNGGDGFVVAEISR